MTSDRITPESLRARKGGSPPITLLPVYDATFARLLDRAGIDILLVGDTLGQLVQGRENPLAVSVEDVIYHLQCVGRAARRGLLVGDMPFMSFQISPEEALRNAGKLVKEGGARAVKLEGGERIAETVNALTRAGIPVIGHIGVQPQSMLITGEMRLSAGKALEDIRQLLRDARAIAEAGAFAVVVEAVPREVGKKVTESIPIPTLGIGAGPDCDGQVLVTHDLLGLFTEFKPKFVKRYAHLAETIEKALGEFLADVREKRFPDEEHSYHLKDSSLLLELERLP
ncbi:MAG: 3-methyl-2-oxobutanoate hydroxymethyltransferase [bacterium]|nr:3-methyl-2-oxobutanoate hydroxymethyltransferase [bacterium]